MVTFYGGMELHCLSPAIVILGANVLFPHKENIFNNANVAKL